MCDFVSSKYVDAHETLSWKTVVEKSHLLRRILYYATVQNQHCNLNSTSPTSLTYCGVQDFDCNKPRETRELCDIVTPPRGDRLEDNRT